jgi:hypothetical protein
LEFPVTFVLSALTQGLFTQTTEAVMIALKPKLLVVGVFDATVKVSFNVKVVPGFTTWLE